MSYRVLVVEVHKLLRDGIRALLDHSGEFTVAGEAESVTEAVQLCTELHPDVVLMAIALPGLNGIEGTAELLRNCPDAKVIMLSMYDDENSVVSSIRAGAQGYMVKGASSEDLLNALRVVVGGSSYLSPSVSKRLLSRIRRGENAGPHRLLARLTARELQVLAMIVEGKVSKEIAVLLGLSVETVRSYRKTMMKKLNVNNVAGLLGVAHAAGLMAKIQQGATGTQ